MHQRKSKKIFIYFFFLIIISSTNNLSFNNLKFDNINDIEISGLSKKEKLDQIMNMSLRAHKAIGCKGVTRSDFKFSNGKFYLLEINTQPGMTNLSLVPEIAAYKGISFI